MTVQITLSEDETHFLIWLAQASRYGRVRVRRGDVDLSETLDPITDKIVAQIREGEA